MNKKKLIPYILFSFILSTHFTNSSAHTKVRDNYLYFTNGVQSVSFTAGSHCITPGQPYRTLDGSQAQKAPSGIGIDIKAGRHTSSQTVHCMLNMFDNARPDKKFTFNNRAGNLNFATKGSLTIDGKIFDGIVLAQGRSGARNNWWFGGINCTVPSVDSSNKDQVTCTATDGTQWCFIRGSSGTVASTSSDHVKVEKYKCTGSEQ